MNPLPLGPFELYEPIGRGGMGEVWRGMHLAQQVPVAVKVLTSKGMRRSFFLMAFRTEVRAMAGLDHPGIALVYDHGEVAEATATASGGRLTAGSPFLAMELAHGGTLAPWCGRLSWVDCRDVLLGLLDALAHAHARGVVHRDLKPANVLLCTDEDLRPGIKLTDFGLAHLPELVERVPQRGPTAGTPHYMAPEQVQGRRRDYGPWTDLYSLGRLALALVWGSPAPSEGRDVRGTAVPTGFDAWVARLLQAEPEDRFQRAADAALALLDLGEPDGDAGGSGGAGRLIVAAETFALTGVESSSSRGGITDAEDRPRLYDSPAGLGLITAVTPLTPLTPPSSHSGASQPSEPPLSDLMPLRPLDSGLVPPPATGGDATPRRVPPAPATWRPTTPPQPPLRLLGAGLALYGMRAIPLVDRELERDALWELLRRVQAERTLRVAVLVGPAGSGKSRLAEWLGERAHEVGAVTVVRAFHAPLPGPADGLGPALSRLLRCADLERSRVQQRLEVLLRRQGVRDPGEWHALTELVAPATREDLEPGVEAIQFASPTERYMVVQRVLERYSLERPTLVWLDDVQWGLDALQFALHLLRAEAPPTSLLVLTVREEALAERPEEASVLSEILALPGTLRLGIGPLPPEAHASLVRGLLGLEGELAASVEARTAGNPLFAVQLVGDWVHRGLLEPGERGFRLRPGARVDLPDLLHKVWVARVETVLRGRPAAHGVALEIAAVLGQEVSGAEWRAACAMEGVEAPLEVVEELLAQRLARGVEGGPDGGWAFVHGMLRESLERRSREAGRWWSHHRACAAMLARRMSPDEVENPRAREDRLYERLGRHLMSAGDHDEALLPLTLAARERFHAGDYAQTAVLLTERERAIAALELPPDDPRPAEGWLLRGSLARVRGRIEEARTWINQTLDVARAHGWTRLEAQALLEMGRICWNLGKPDEAIRVLQGCESRAVALGDRRLLASCRRDLGGVVWRRGDSALAEAYYRLALSDWEAIGDRVGEASSLTGLGAVARETGQYDEAREHFLRALALLERVSSRRGQADALNDLGELARLQGKLEEAEDLYRQAITHHRATGSTLAFIPEVNLALVLVDREHYSEAKRTLEQLYHNLESQGRRLYRAYLHAYLLPCLAHDRDWSSFTLHLSQASSILTETRLVDRDIGRLAELAGELALASGQKVLGREALRLALHQWQRLESREHVATIERRLRSVR